MHGEGFSGVARQRGLTWLILCGFRRGDVHRVDHIGEQNRHLLVLRRSADLCNRCTALITELGVQRQFRATRTTRQSCCCQRTTSVVHANIVSLLVNDVRHIAVPTVRRRDEVSRLSYVVYFETALSATQARSLWS